MSIGLLGKRVAELEDVVANYEKQYAAGDYDQNQKESICRHLHELWNAANAGLAGQSDAFSAATGGGNKDNAEGGVQKGLTPDQKKWKESLNDASTKLEGLAGRIGKLCPNRKVPGTKETEKEPPPVQTPLRVPGDKDAVKPGAGDKEDDKQHSIGVVAPNNIVASEPFTFAVAQTGTIEGEVVDVRTIEGEVIQRHKTDKLGRIFLPAGLAAGSYMITRQAGRPAGILNVQPLAAGPGASAPPSLNLQTADPTLCAANRADPLRLTGTGVNPDAARMSVSASGKSLPVLASSSGELVTVPPTALRPGTTALSIRNSASGAETKVDNVLVYDLKAQLMRRKLVGGEQTVLELQFAPKEIDATLRADVVDGPVRFANGQRQTTLPTKNGRAELTVQSTPGSTGPFRLAYTLLALPTPNTR
jgi:hypothetical protein